MVAAPSQSRGHPTRPWLSLRCSRRCPRGRRRCPRGLSTRPRLYYHTIINSIISLIIKIIIDVIIIVHISIRIIIIMIHNNINDIIFNFFIIRLQEWRSAFNINFQIINILVYC